MVFKFWGCFFNVITKVVRITPFRHLASELLDQGLDNDPISISMGIVFIVLCLVIRSYRVRSPGGALVVRRDYRVAIYRYEVIRTPSIIYTCTITSITLYRPR